MKHARPDYDRIQDPAGKIPEDEPVFLLRAQDKHFVSMLAYYRFLVRSTKGDSKIIRAVEDHVDRAIAWQQAYGSKSPDMPEDPPEPPYKNPGLSGY